MSGRAWVTAFAFGILLPVLCAGAVYAGYWVSERYW